MPDQQSHGNPLGVVHEVPEDEIDALFANEVEEDGPGAAVGVYHRGSLLFTKGYGLADLESGQPITAQTPFHVASVSKQFTAFAVALLAREGRLDLDAAVRDYLPYVPKFNDVVTVRHLILHTSGLRNQIMLVLLGGQGLEGRVTQQQVVNLVSRQQSLNFPPGTEYSYSNTGYILLAEIVFRITGQTLREFTTDRIFAPLGMECTFFFDDVTEVVPYRANSYARRRDEEGQEKAGWARAPLNFDNVGSSSLFTTVEDLGHWAGNLTDPLVGDKALIEQVCSSGTLNDGTAINYCFGLERGEMNGHTVLRHTGSDAAFRSVFVHFPAHDFAVAVLANTELGLMSKIESIANLYLSDRAEPATAVSAEDSRVDLSRFEGTYVPPHDISCRLEVHEETLMHHWGNRTPEKLTARVDGTLDFGTASGQSFFPVLGTAGEVTGLEVPRPGCGLPLYMERFTDPEVSPIYLGEYSGEFHSPELDITYSVNAGNGELFAHHLWSNHMLTLAAVVPDRFESPGDRLKFQLKMIFVFQRNDEGLITSLLIHTSGERNIHFDRVGDARAPAPVASTPAQRTWN